MRFHLFHDWVMVGDEHRQCTKCDRLQAFSPELGAWVDLDHLRATNYDKGAWLQQNIDLRIADARKEGESR